MWAWSSCGGGDDDTELGEQEVTGDVLAWRKKKKNGQSSQGKLRGVGVSKRSPFGD